MRTQVQQNVLKLNVLKLGLTLLVIMYFALNGFPQGDNSKKIRPILRISGTYTEGAYTDEAVVFFDPMCSEDFSSKTDAHKLMNTEPTIPNIYTVKSDQKLAINGLPSIYDDLVIPVGYDVTLPGTYTISANEITNFDPTTTNIYLEDLAMNVSQDLNANPNYMFKINPADKGSRFFIRFKLTSTGISKDIVNRFTNLFTTGNQLVVNNSVDNSRLEVYSVQGQKVFESKNINSGQHIFTLNTNPGCYIVKLYSKSEAKVQKVYIY
jgi:hypothetical protein